MRLKWSHTPKLHTCADTRQRAYPTRIGMWQLVPDHQYILCIKKPVPLAFSAATLLTFSSFQPLVHISKPPPDTSSVWKQRAMPTSTHEPRYISESKLMSLLGRLFPGQRYSARVGAREYASESGLEDCS